MLRKARTVLSTETGRKFVQLINTDQNNPTSVGAGYQKHSLKEKKNSHQTNNVEKGNLNFKYMYKVP